ncbi:hypothetical protein Arub01_58840 [Actinomadura rubrobrunea]|jgi:hypothetical protein|uniref:Uncharacterized protein n=2 Tax=Actinomadura rubrobrunea TaxID=115335 RepID=A0A9W6Q342_9ACTN|nr:hypothetical protein Arub01_58840 [Actinomadura rubrobrunea]
MIHSMGDQPLLRLGAQMAEVEALYARVLDAPDQRTERDALLELAGAGARLADLARGAAGVPAGGPKATDGAVAGGGAQSGGRRKGAPVRVRTACSAPPPRRRKLERRISGARRTVDWIVSRTGGTTG